MADKGKEREAKKNKKNREPPQCELDQSFMMPSYDAWSPISPTWTSNMYTPVCYGLPQGIPQGIMASVTVQYQ